MERVRAMFRVELVVDGPGLGCEVQSQVLAGVRLG